VITEVRRFRDLLDPDITGAVKDSGLHHCSPPGRMGARSTQRETEGSHVHRSVLLNICPNLYMGSSKTVKGY
jgi:hypothetical protein